MTRRWAGTTIKEAVIPIRIISMEIVNGPITTCALGVLSSIERNIKQKNIPWEPDKWDFF